MSKCNRSYRLQYLLIPAPLVYVIREAIYGGGFGNLHVLHAFGSTNPLHSLVVRVILFLGAGDFLTGFHRLLLFRQ
jgi:hypothetical protein